jgi:hypothetical protein
MISVWLCYILPGLVLVTLEIIFKYVIDYDCNILMLMFKIFYKIKMILMY